MKLSILIVECVHCDKKVRKIKYSSIITLAARWGGLLALKLTQFNPDIYKDLLCLTAMLYI